MTEGRQALHSFRPETVEWAIPVLFTRVADGRIFVPGAEAVPAPEEASRPASPTLFTRRRLAWAAVALLALLLIFLAPRIGERLAAFEAGAELPQIERVRVDNLEVARYETSNAEYLQFVKEDPEWRKDRIRGTLHDGDYLKLWISPTEYPPGLGDHPVTHVSWFAAEAFCEWAGGSLPTQEQWQKVAHTAEGEYPWGTPDPDGEPPVNFCDGSCDKPYRGAIDLPLYKDGYPETAPVSAFPAGATREGVLNLSGNVWEWTLTVSGDEGVTLGGSFASTFDECSTDVGLWELKTTCARDGGFRCVWGLR
ncbi:MAG TPA: formylglycine-generating enzyme family protein [Thermoanaerobaculia bacterium]|nr:formylglycine-generating enzyme family protein [Thermoanaerobaculia bacterium]